MRLRSAIYRLAAIFQLMTPLSVIFCFVLLASLLLIWSYVLRSVWTQTSKLRSFLVKFSVSFSTTISLFLILEIVLCSFVISDGFNFTLSSHRWFEKYWHPINSLGYRDVEHSPAEFRDKRVIWVVGDSFVAGQGISRIENRFSDILQRNLGGKYLVAIIAQPGWNTADEYRAMLSYPYKPKRIILSYLVNDIIGANLKLGYGYPVHAERPRNPIVEYSVEHSYVINFVYWRLFRVRNRDMGNKDWEYLTASYSNPGIWNVHEAELTQIISYARNQDIALTVVLFPDLTNVKGSAVITSRVADFFQAHNIPVLNLEPLWEGRDPNSLMVNSLDSHPNEALNKEVAELLTRQIQAEEFGK